MLDEIYEALKESHPADRYQIKKYIAWVGFRRTMHDQFYIQAHWVYAKKEPPQIVEAHARVLNTHAGNAHWV